MIYVNVKFSNEKINTLLESYSKKFPVARVGILGTGARSSSGKGKKAPPTNAEVGSFHEFGTTTIPRRSFLKEPILNYFEEYMAKASRDLKISNNLNPDLLMKKIAILGERVVLDAFHTGGFGEWKPTQNMDAKKVKQTLVETQQLRNSITSDVE